MSGSKFGFLENIAVSLVSGLLFFSSTIAYAQDLPVVQMIKRNATGFAIDGSNNSNNGQDVFLWAENEANRNQQWVEIDRGDGYYSYRKVNSDYCLDGGNGGADGQNVYLWECGNSNQNQHWAKVNVGGGHYQLVKRNAPGYAIDGNNRGSNRQSVYLWSINANNKNQHWQFNYVNDDPDYAGCIEVDTLSELSTRLDSNNQCVRVMPGTYTFDTSNVGNGLLFSDPSVLKFSGSGNRFIFDDVTFNFDTEIFRQFGRAEIHEFHVTGRDNVFENLTMTDQGDVAPVFRARAVLMDGSNNLVDGFTITTRGSFPYGYGDIFGKGGGSVIRHTKHSGVLIRGDGNHLRSLDLYMNSYGHGVFVQGGDDVLIEDVYVEGNLSTVNAVLAEDGSGSPADNVDFLTVWGYNLDELDRDYRFSLQEDGIRAYSSGGVYGSDESRNTGSVTVRNSTVKHMRSGVTIGWARGDKYVENATTLGVESGFWVGSNARVVNSRGDASVGPLFADEAYRSGSTLELTLIPYVVSKLGDMPSLYLVGADHNLTLKNGTTSAIDDIKLQIGGVRNAHRWLAGSGEEPPNTNADDVVLDNQTPYRVEINDNSVGATVLSCGTVTDLGRVSRVTTSSNNCR